MCDGGRPPKAVRAHGSRVHHLEGVSLRIPTGTGWARKRPTTPVLMIFWTWRQVHILPRRVCTSEAVETAKVRSGKGERGRSLKAVATRMLGEGAVGAASRSMMRAEIVGRRRQ